jgi:hypothetical protein
VIDFKVNQVCACKHLILHPSYGPIRDVGCRKSVMPSIEPLLDANSKANARLHKEAYSQLEGLNPMKTSEPTVKPVSQVKLVISIDAFAGKDQITGDGELVKLDRYFGVRRLREKFTEISQERAANRGKTVEYDSCGAVLSSIKRSVSSSTVLVSVSRDLSPNPYICRACSF